MKKNIKQFNQRGMTLIETVMALGILITGITASLTLMTSTINFSKKAERSIIVTNLAREGIGMVRTLRDYGKTISNDSFDNLGTGNFVVYAGTSGELLKNDSNTEYINECDACKIYLKDNKYTHDSSDSEETIYRRLITISDVVSGQEKKIISKIYWNDRGNTYNYEIEARLTNW